MQALEKQKKEAILALIDKADKGKLSAQDLDQWKQYLGEIEDLWRVVGDVAEMSITRLVREAFPKDKLVTASTEAGMEAIKKDLGYETAPQLEKMLIDQICYCWLAHSVSENRYSAVVTGSTTLAQGDHWERRMLGPVEYSCSQKQSS